MGQGAIVQHSEDYHQPEQKLVKEEPVIEKGSQYWTEYRRNYENLRKTQQKMKQRKEAIFKEAFED